MPSPLRLLFRGDDAGSARSANLAIRECVEGGLLRNVSVMVPGPVFTHAAEVFAGISGETGLGLHVTLNSEWAYPKWGPVLPVGRVPSLVEETGHFTFSPGTLRGRGFSVEEALAEIEAQLDLACRHGLPVEYIDEHMGVSRAHPELRAGIAELARRRGLVDAHGVPVLPDAPTPGADLVENWVLRLEHAAANGGGTFVLITHPTYNDEEMHAFRLSSQQPGEAARPRDDDRRALLDPRLRAACERLGVELIRYGDLARPWRRCSGV